MKQIYFLGKQVQHAVLREFDGLNVEERDNTVNAAASVYHDLPLIKEKVTGKHIVNVMALP